MTCNQKQHAWRLWELLQEAADLLWSCFEDEFVEDILQELHLENAMRIRDHMEEEHPSFDELPF